MAPGPAWRRLILSFQGMTAGLPAPLDLQTGCVKARSRFLPRLHYSISLFDQLLKQSHGFRPCSVLYCRLGLGGGYRPLDKAGGACRLGLRKPFSPSSFIAKRRALPLGPCKIGYLLRCPNSQVRGGRIRAVRMLRPGAYKKVAFVFCVGLPLEWGFFSWAY